MLRVALLFIALLLAPAGGLQAAVSPAECAANYNGTCNATCGEGFTGVDSCGSGLQCCAPTKTPGQTGGPTEEKAKEESVVKYQSYGYEDPLGGVSIPSLVARIINQVLPLVGALFLIMFIWGGFQWFTAGGDEGKIKRARQTLMNAAIGIAIVMGAYLLVSNVLNILGAGLTQGSGT